MKILITAFDPFGGEEKNSSMIVMERLKDRFGDVEIKKLLVPTVYNECARIAFEEAESWGADAILCMGQAGGRIGITVEVIGINYACSAMSDNKGVRFDGVKLKCGGADGLFSTLPVKEMAEAVKNLGFEASVSVSAGGFVCNSMLYLLLYKAKEKGWNIPIGFVHVPYEESQGKEGYSMKKDDICICIEKMIEVIKNSKGVY